MGKERILFDEYLTPKLVARARGRGYDATHVTYLGKASYQDYNLVDVILEGDFVFFTNDARDFIKIFSGLDIHNELVILFPKTRREEQIALFEAVMDFIEGLDHTMNRLIEVHAVDDIRLSNLPPGD